MDAPHHLALPLLAILAIGRPGPEVAAQHRDVTIVADFSERWSERWEEVRLASRTNDFAVGVEDGIEALRASSDGSASALWHPVDISPRHGERVTWRWKVETPLPGNEREREKRGDDYAARLFVIFDAEPFSRQARAVCYVWASHEPEGSVYPNPYFANVTTIVVQSGADHVGEWVREERDFVSDYRDAFGEDPETVTAVAVMVDTDDTASRAVAWFDAIEMRIPDAGYSATARDPG
ncbi:MAG: DUF3047 domain-containing protein [Gemmatimonadales bacterium]|jgi:hypothetical protein